MKFSPRVLRISAVALFLLETALNACAAPTKSTTRVDSDHKSVTITTRTAPPRPLSYYMIHNLREPAPANNCATSAFEVVNHRGVEARCVTTR